MKKSLSLILAFAMVFSMFSSLAFAADADLTAQQKYDALKAKGIFAGMADGSAGLDQNMNRAQFARVAALISGLEGIGATDTKVVTAKPFSDVELGKWYTEEVAAAKEAGLFVGNADGTFNPEGNISVQELAVVVANLLNIEPVADATVEGAADWAAGYIKALVDAGVDFPTNYTQPAVRADLASLAFQADAKINPVAPAKVSVVSAKASGVSKVEVTLDKAVDDTKAKIELKFGTAVVSLDSTKWSDDKKVATLTLKDQKIREGKYTATLTGLEAAEVATASATFTGEKETVKSIEFVTASDEVAKSRAATIKVKAENQYGELASFNVSSYEVNTGDIANTKKVDEQGYLIISVNTILKNTGLDVVPVYIYFKDTRVVANKTFKVGSVPFVSKLELTEPTYNNDAKALTKSGNVVSFNASLYDQYGNPVTPTQETADGLTINWSSYLTPFTESIATTFKTVDDVYKVELSVKAAKKIEKSSTYQVTVLAGAASAIGSFETKSEKVAKAVSIGDPSKTIAAGDASALIPITVTDEAGNALTAQEIVDNRTLIDVTGGSLVLYGKDKGQVKVTAIPATKNSYFSVNVMVKSTIGEAPGYDTRNFQVAEERIPSSIVVDKAPAAKAVLSAKSEFKVLVKDQYGEKVTDDVAGLPDAYTVVATVTGATYADAISKKGAAYDLTAGNPTETFTFKGADGFDELHEGYNFQTKGVDGEAEVKFVLKKGSDEINSKTVRIKSIPANSELTYTLEAVGELYAALDNKNAVIDATILAGGDVAKPDQEEPALSKFAKQVKIAVKDSSNDTVAFPDRVVDVVSSNLNTAHTEVSGAPGTADGKGYVLGNKAGTGSVTVYVLAANGTQKALTSSVTVKSDAIVVKTIGTKSEKDLAVAIGTADSIADIHATMEIKTTDQYGVSIEKADVRAYDKALGIRFEISDVQVRNVVDDATNQVTISGQVVTVGSEVQEFIVTAVSRDGSVVGTTLFKRP